MISQDINHNFTCFIDKIQKLYSECFPIKTKFISEKRLNNPWITQAVLNSIKTKNNLYKDYKIGAITENQFKEYRNKLNRTIKQAKQSYYVSVFSNFKNNTTKIWNTVNKIYKDNKDSTTKYIYSNGIKITNHTEIAETFNEFYTNIAHKLDNELPTSNIDPITFLKGNYQTSMVVPPVNTYDVINVINSLKNKKGNVNELSVSLLKTNKNQLAVPLATLFNHSISSGKFPHYLKHATVIPIHKKGTKDDLKNYRPISLLSVYSKIFEKLIKKFLINYLDSKSIISLEQFGFRHGLSTFDALITFNEKIYTTLDSQNSLLGIFIDFTKAFDTVNHDILLQKLNHYGIRGIIQDWFRDYLTNRMQTVRFLNHTSTPQQIKYGIPQGSV